MPEALPEPFTLVYRALFDLALRHPSFVSLVKIGNRVSFAVDDNRDPIKQNVITADMPEVTLITEGMSAANIHQTSSTSSIRRRYSFIIVTGDYRVNYALYPVEWYLFCAMVGWKTTLGNLTWHGATFVKNANLVSLTEGESDSRRIKGTKGWTSIWSVDVEMHFSSSHLFGELTE